MGRKEKIAMTIRTMRKSRQMTQEDLAKSIGQSPSSITMYENGRRTPDVETMEALADVFNVPLTSLYGDEGIITDPEPSQSEETRLLVRGFSKLTKEQQEQALNVMKAVFAQYADYFDKGNETNEDT